MREIGNWIEKVKQILAWVTEKKVAYAEITLTVKGGKVVFIDYRGPLKGEGDGE